MAGIILAAVLTFTCKVISPPVKHGAESSRACKEFNVPIFASGANAVYDHRYWDAEVNRSTNSYVDASLKAGYSIMTYDRLGVGQSDKPDGYTIVPAPLELEILHQLALMAQNGTLYSMAKKAAPNAPEIQQLTQPSRIVHVGHSYGSFLTSAFFTSFGSISDGAILTGVITIKKEGALRAATFDYEYAATGSPTRFSDRPSGYVVPETRSSIQRVFFGGNPETAFAKEMLDYGELIKRPVTVGEWTSVSALHLGIAPASNGPLHHMVREFDFPTCAGNCKGTYDLVMLKNGLPNAAAVELYIQPNTGHGMTLHRNATAGYQATFDSWPSVVFRTLEGS